MNVTVEIEINLQNLRQTSENHNVHRLILANNA